MGPQRKRFWLPLTRLGAFFVAVVVMGNVVLHAFRPVAADLTSTPDQSVDYFAKKKKRLERQFYRTMEKFLGAPVAVPVKDKVSEQSTTVQPVALAAPATLPPVETPPAARPADPLPPTATASLTPPPPLWRPARLGFVDPEVPPFVWPEPLPPPGSRGLDVPPSISLLEESLFRADLVGDLYRRSASDPVADVGDAMLRLPEMLLDGIFTCASGMGTRSDIRQWDDDNQRSVTAQILDVHIGPRKERIWAEFMRQFTDREVKYLSNFGDSRADTWGFEDRTQDANHYELMLDQRKVLWDALRRTYVSRYKVQADERIREDAWYLDRWSGADYLILPPLLGGYIFYRGLEKRFSISGTKLLLAIEPVSEWYRPGKHDRAAAIALEWTMKDCPLGVIVSAGLHDGRYAMDFIGIGTSLGAVKRALVMQQGERR
jgi:hypothetical protein